MKHTIPYVNRKVRRYTRKDGTVWEKVYFIYRRKGAPDHGATLPGDPSKPEFTQTLAIYNARAEDTISDLEAAPYSVSWLVNRYLSSPEFAALRPNSKDSYRRYLKQFEADFHDLDFRTLTRNDIHLLRDEGRDKPQATNKLLAVLRIALGWALVRGWITENPADRFHQLPVKPRQKIWSREEQERFLTLAAQKDPMIGLAFLLALYTAQRQSDILKMTWAQFQDGEIRLRQSKTAKPVCVPCCPRLYDALHATERVAVTILTNRNGHPFKADNFKHRWHSISVAAECEDLHFRDLRRTAMTRMAEEGATVIEISAVSGHDIDSTQSIIDTYVPRQTQMAKNAIRHLENWEKKGRAKGQK